MQNIKSNCFDSQRVVQSNQGVVNSSRNLNNMQRLRFRNQEGSIRLAVTGSNHGLAQTSRIDQYEK